MDLLLNCPSPKKNPIKMKPKKDKFFSCDQINIRRLLDFLNTFLISREEKVFTREKSKTYVEADVVSLSQSNTDWFVCYC